ncbi:chitin synthase III catalytic subunit [Mycena albidolilacea]|uniref:Chitin synthase III catalytic subunit n=1 Tax=Mycena albidolilacea TaxID=1033008 RepID=A0AAD7E8Q2_9AGAR|nr:chitin synthase III catalytic subunit [Mycena albidolilacea]
MTRFGDFDTLCRDTPSYTWCNLFYRQILNKASDVFTNASLPTSSAGLGVNPTCAIPRMGHENSLGNIANIVVCALSMVFTAVLIWVTNKRKAAVGRIELRTFLSLYFLTLPLQLVTTGSFLEQGGTPLVIITAIHAGVVAALFWALLANALVATQVVEDGTPSSLIPFYALAIVFFAATTYISLDIGLSITSVFGPSKPPQNLGSIPLFVLTSIWPAATVVIYFALMTYIVLAVLNEVRPMWFYILSAALFVLSQLDYFLLSKVICKGSNQKVDGSFVATFLETAAVGVLYLAWKSITEESWDEDAYYPS